MHTFFMLYKRYRRTGMSRRQALQRAHKVWNEGF